MRLAGKTVLITGASSGIGRACAERLAEDGAELILTGRRREALEETAERAGGGRVIVADLADERSLAGFCEIVLSGTASIDVLIHNAGVGIYAASYETDPAKAKRLMALNFLAPVEITRRLLPRIPEGGSVVMISSIAGKVSLPGMGVYCASKHALNAYAATLRMETSHRSIHVMSVCPGYVVTPFMGNMLQGATSRAAPGRKRFAITAEQCAQAVRNGLHRRSRTVVVPKIGWLLVAAERLFPATLHGQLGRRLPTRLGK